MKINSFTGSGNSTAGQVDTAPPDNIPSCSSNPGKTNSTVPTDTLSTTETHPTPYILSERVYDNFDKCSLSRRVNPPRSAKTGVTYTEDEPLSLDEYCTFLKV